jgi:hypothetical protein
MMVFFCLAGTSAFITSEVKIINIFLWYKYDILLEDIHTDVLDQKNQSLSSHPSSSVNGRTPSDSTWFSQVAHEHFQVCSSSA